MQKFIGLFIAFSVLLSACRFPSGGASAVTAAPPASDTPVLSLADTAAPVPTKTLAPTSTLIPETLTPDTRSVTPLPTIPTFTPTFDVRTIVTATPAPAMCPKENPNLTIDLGLSKIKSCINLLTPDGYYDTYSKCIDREMQAKILDFLNRGGDINIIISQLHADGRQKDMIFQDLTHDGVNDFVFRDTDGMYNGYFFYTCRNGVYISQSIGDGDPYIGLMHLEIRDLNANGIPEIVVTEAGVLLVFEWDGNSFAEILRTDDYGASSFEIWDVDKNGLQEITMSRGAPPNRHLWEELPWRHYVSIYAWNGVSYVRVSKTFDAPVYRFQAIQDADQYLINGNYQKAFEFYQGAIFNNELGWWSPERRDYEIKKYYSLADPNNKPTLSPTEDLTEYPRLAAYGYYRMVILHTYLGEMDAAQIKYNTLQEKFPAGNPGHPYVEMATDFWNAYQSSGKMYNACAAAIAYADAHPEILTPLGSDYHGAQSHIYVPADVCPFR